MPKLVKIGDRIINLDAIKYVERFDNNGQEEVQILLEPNKVWRLLEGQRKIEENPRMEPLNMVLYGANAKFIWEKLSEHAETWEMPEPEGEEGRVGWATGRG
jgi:hypothetical protein